MLVLPTPGEAPAGSLRSLIRPVPAPDRATPASPQAGSPDVAGRQEGGVAEGRQRARVRGTMDTIPPTHLTLLLQRYRQRDESSAGINYSGYDLFWPDGRPVRAGL